MKFKKVIFSFHSPLMVIMFLFTFLPGITTAQNLQEEAIDSDGLYSYVLNKYGIDHELVNGIELYNLYRHVKYHPYYLGEESLQGSVTLSGKRFDHLIINYDIYNQWLVLDYKELSGGINKVILEPLHTDGFQLGGNYFEKLALDDRGLLFYQVIRVNDLTCYIHWKKMMASISNNINFGEGFSDPWRTFFLEYEGTIYPFSNRRNFASIFSGTSGREISVYMRKNNIRFRKVSIQNLTGLLEHISPNHQ